MKSRILKEHLTTDNSQLSDSLAACSLFSFHRGEVGAILILEILMIICVLNLTHHSMIQVGKKTNNCLNFSLVFPITWILINISAVII